MAPSKILKSQEKKSTAFTIFFQSNRNFPKNYRFFLKQHIFLDSRSSSRHFDYLFICLDLIIKLIINYFQRNVEL